MNKTHVKITLPKFIQLVLLSTIATEFRCMLLQGS